MNQRIVPDLFSIPIARWTSIAIASTLLGCGAPPRDSVEQSADALAALPDFGYGNMKTNGNIPEGHRPLFAIEVDDGANPGVLHTAAYYQSLLFGPGPSGFNANDYYLGNSIGRFGWMNAGNANLGSVTVPPNTDLYNFALQRALATQGFQFWKNFDTNNDGLVTNDELTFIFFDTSSPLAAQTSGASFTLQGPTNLTVTGLVSGVGAQAGLLNVCHELGHTLQGANGVEIYQNTARYWGVSIMGATIGNVVDDTRIWSFDPWHKLQFAWLSTGTQLHTDFEPAWSKPLFVGGATVLIYDSVSHFYLIERRISTGYDAQGPGDGLLIWNIDQDSTTKVGRPTMGTRNSVQNGDVDATAGIPGWDYSVWTLGPPNALPRYGSPSVWTSSPDPIQLEYANGKPYHGKLFIDPGFTLRWQPTQ